jgi:hypothetical protein
MADIPQKNGNPIAGKFSYINIHDENYTVTISLADIPARVGTRLYIVTHADVQDADTGVIESAWGDGSDFPGRNWATYFTYEVQRPSVGSAPRKHNVLPTVWGAMRTQ